MRFFGNRTQSQIAEVIGVSQMRISRLLDRTSRSFGNASTAEGRPLRLPSLLGTGDV